MATKYCTACGWSVDHAILTCPNCSSSNFDHREAEGRIDAPIRDALNTQLKSQAEIDEESRLKLDESIDPKILAKFKERLKRELEEIAYLEWRAIQPSWKVQAEKAGVTSTQHAEDHPMIDPRVYSTAAGVLIGTSGIRGQLSAINDSINEDSVENSEVGSGDDEGGVLDMLGGIFD